jgi:DNA-binding NtrC family response regulator
MMHMIIHWSGEPQPPALDEVLKSARIEPAHSEAPPGSPVIVCTRSARRVPSRPGEESNAGWIWLCHGTVDEGHRREAILRGAYAVVSLADPSAPADLVARVTELLTPLPEPPADSTLALDSLAARRVVEQVARVAPTSMSVLFTGETGTGKEVMARLTHAWSPRQKKPFIPINCAAIPNELMEAELFGYARGAFSGAVQRYDGQLMAAAGGTVLLDEIDDTPLETQVKLLRVLEDHVVSRLGENVWHQVDFRLLAATNRDLQSLIAAGRFGQDLYERLAIVTIRLAPLRERLEDLPRLARHFMKKFAEEQRQPAVNDIRPDALRVMTAYPWPGNIRELRNVIYETLVYKRAGTTILMSDLPRRILSQSATGDSPAADRGVISTKIAERRMNLREEVESLERIAIEEALSRTGGNAAEAARLLGEVGRGMSHDPGGTVRAMMRRLRKR